MFKFSQQSSRLVKYTLKNTFYFSITLLLSSVSHLCMMKKVLIITYYWPPAGGPGVQRWLKMTKYLPQFGFEPIVLTVSPERATYPLRDETLANEVPHDLRVYGTNTSELFSLYKKTSGRKEVPFSGFANESDKPGPRQRISKWVRGNFFVPDPRKGWNRHAIKKAIQLIEEEEIELVVTTSPPHSSQLIGLALKKKFSALKWVADLRDPWTDIYYYDQFYPTKVAKAYDRYLERKALTEADGVSVVSASMKRLLAAKVPGQEDKFMVIPNGFDAPDFTKAKAPQSKPTGEAFTIAYTGTITQQYGIEVFLEVLSNLSKQYKLKLVFVGKRDELLEKKLKGLSFVELRESVPHQESVAFIQEVDALLLAIPDIRDNAGIITGKIFEYMAAKRPIIGIGPLEGDAAKLLKETDSGVLFNYSDSQGLTNYLEALLLGEHSFSFQTEQYARKAITGRFVDQIKNA